MSEESISNMNIYNYNGYKVTFKRMSQKPVQLCLLDEYAPLMDLKLVKIDYRKLVVKWTNSLMFINC